jgi:DNA polymerase III delta prime subunit
MPVQHDALLSERFRPTVLTDLLLPDRDIARLQRIVASGNLPNMLFYGSPGRGKTSAARILQHELDADIYELNGSSISGDKAMEKKITSVAHDQTMLLKPKILLIDEADYLDKRIQQSMRHIVETSSTKCRFILTANDASRIIPALQSRLTAVNFDLPISETRSVVERLKSTIPTKLTELGWKFDTERVFQIISLYYPDMRSVVNNIEYEFA